MLRFSWIEDHRLGACSRPFTDEDLEVITAHGIRAILTLTENPLGSEDHISSSQLARLNLKIHHLPIIDYQAPTVEQALEGADFLEKQIKAGIPVMVHCYAGQERTGTMLHAYYITQGLAFEATKDLIREKRPISAFEKLMDVQKAFLNQFAQQNHD